MLFGVKWQESLYKQALGLELEIYVTIRSLAMFRFGIFYIGTYYCLTYEAVLLLLWLLGWGGD